MSNRKCVIHDQEYCDDIRDWRLGLPTEVVELIDLYSTDISSVDYSTDAHRGYNGGLRYTISVIVNYSDGWVLSINARRIGYDTRIGFAELSKTIGTSCVGERIITVDLLKP